MDEATQKAFEGYLRNGGSIAEMQGIGAQQLDVLYSFAHGRFAHGDIEAARQLFLAITVIDSRRFDAWMGLGLSYQRQQRHAEALFCLARATVMAVTDPRPLLACAVSLRCINKHENARMAYDTAIRFCGKRTEYAALKLQAIEALASMKEEA